MKYVLRTIEQCLARLTQVVEAYKEKKKITKIHINKITYCIRRLNETKMQVEKDLEPKKPRTINDALTWVATKKKEGTYLALMTEDATLLKTMFVTEKILDEMPKFNVEVTPIELKMNKIELVIESLNIRKAVPKKTYALVGITRTTSKTGQPKAEVIKPK